MYQGTTISVKYPYSLLYIYKSFTVDVQYMSEQNDNSFYVSFCLVCHIWVWVKGVTARAGRSRHSQQTLTICWVCLVCPTSSLPPDPTHHYLTALLLFLPKSQAYTVANQMIGLQSESLTLDLGRPSAKCIYGHSYDCKWCKLWANCD